MDQSNARWTWQFRPDPCLICPKTNACDWLGDRYEYIDQFGTPCMLAYLRRQKAEETEVTGG